MVMVLWLRSRTPKQAAGIPPRVRERLKLRWDDVKQANARLIYASLTGYGDTGPDADIPGFDANAFFARAGLLDALRYEGQPGRNSSVDGFARVNPLRCGSRPRNESGRSAGLVSRNFAPGLSISSNLRSR